MMNERLTKVKSDSRQFWSSRTKNQKGVLIGTLVAIVAIASVITYFSTKTEMVPLFTELSQSEVGQIKEVLEAQGTKFEIAPGGTNILVSEKEVDALKVSLMSQGYPETGGISTSFFAENAGFGITDNEFNVIKQAALETEIADLYKRIDGVKDAKVKVVMPESSVFLSETTQESQAMVMLTTDAGHKFTDEQIKTLYNIVGKSVPNLTNDNIQITNQYGEYFDLTTTASNSATTAEGQMAIKKQIERDLQRQVQNMLGTMMGQDKVVVSVSTDIDFKQVNSTEDLVEPVDEENIEGLTISAQRITETYSGTGSVAAGAPEAENVTDNFTDYQEGTTGDGEYERVEETINNDVNRIRNEIQGSPYKVRNIGIQVMVEPPGEAAGATLDENVRTDIEQILETIVRTSIDQDIVNELTDEQISERIVVLSQPFYGKETLETEGQPFIPWWVWVIGGVLLVAIGLLVFYALRSRKQRQAEEEALIIEEQDIVIDDIAEEKETEATLRRKQLEKMAKEKPEDFAKLLRTWIAED